MEMTFEEKISQCIQNFNNIDKPDYSNTELNYYADFIEIYTLLSKGDGITVGDVQDRFFGVKEDDDNPEKEDKNEALLNMIFGVIKERIVLYSEEYPFEYKNDEILLLKQDLTVKNKLYINVV